MNIKEHKNNRVLEICLVIITIALTVLLTKTVGYKMIVLNLFFLPVVLAAFFLGPYCAGVLALLSVIAVFSVSVLTLSDFAAVSSPIVVILGVTIWGAVLGLTAIMAGTLSDERDSTIHELHEAYVGVVEVLSGYLQNANPRLKSRSIRVSELSQKVAAQMNLSPKEIDEIRVAALLHDMANVEITAKVIRKAVGNLESDESPVYQHTFHGTELAHSLGGVLTGAFPLLVNQSDTMQLNALADDGLATSQIPVGARIIRAVRAYDALCEGDFGVPGESCTRAIDELRADNDGDHSHAILKALETVVSRSETRRLASNEHVASKPAELGV